MIIKKHLVKVATYDYGQHLETHWRTASSVDDSGPVSDHNYFSTRKQAESYIRNWLTDAPAKDARAKGFRIERGQNLRRSSDMNPHGLI